MVTLDEALALALQAHQAGDLPRAENIYRQILAHAPRHAEALHLLGTLYTQRGQWDLSVRLQREAIALNPRPPVYHGNLGSTLTTIGRHAEALDVLDRAIALDPNYTAAYYNRGLALEGLGRLEEAAHSYRQAIALQPHDAAPHNNLGDVLRQLGRPDEALAHLDRALALQPNFANAHSNRALVLPSLGRMDEALAHLDQAIALAPDSAKARSNRAMVLLSLGRMTEGWAEYEWRLRCPEFKPRHFPQPMWDGRPLERETLLLHAEQGLGDTLQFIRLLPLVRERCPQVWCEVQRALVPLLEHSGNAGLIPHGDPLPAFDVHLPLMSLGRVFDLTLDKLPVRQSYLKAREDLVAQWRRELDELEANSGAKSFKIGIVWQGRPTFRQDRYRSIPLREFAPLAEVPSVRLISLQKGQGSEQISAVQGAFHVVDLGSRLDEQAGAFMDTAAVMQCLDLVITSDTAAAHLAGGLGVRTWLALGYSPDWRWLGNRDDSPWYPSLRLFRQPALGDWPDVFRRMADELRALVEP